MCVELRNINKCFGDYKASDNVNLKIEKGKLVGLLGPSGSGKTTILRIIAGLEQPDSGQIFINGRCVNDIPSGKREIGFVFQNYALFRYMNVFDNIAFGLEVKKKNKKEIRERVIELIKLVGLEGFEKRYPNQLSGGQRQRVAFARALAPNPQLLLLDEPFAAIDAKIRKELRQWLKEMINKVGITSIFVTHDQEEALEIADEIIITNKGCVQQNGSPMQIYQNPTTPFVAQFIGDSKIINKFNRFKGFEDYEGEKIIIRAEFVKIIKKNESKNINITKYEEGIIKDIIFKGSSLTVKISVNRHEIECVRTLDQEIIEVGEIVYIFISNIYVCNDIDIESISNKVIQ